MDIKKLAHKITLYKNNYYLIFTQKFNELLFTFNKETDNRYLIGSINNFDTDFNFEKHINEILIYSNKSTKYTRDLLNYLSEHMSKGDDKIQAYAKRINENTIKIRFGILDIDFKIIHLFNDFDFIEKDKLENNFVNFGIILHNIYHKLCFPEIYDFINTSDKIFESLEKVQFIYLKSIENTTIKYNKYHRNDKLSNLFEDVIYIGDTAVQKSFFGYDEFIVPIGFTKVLKKIKNNKKIYYKYFKGDFEFKNNYIEIYSGKKLIAKVYDGHNHSYPINGKNGNYLLLIKYCLLHLFKEKDKSNQLLLYLIKNRDKHINNNLGIGKWRIFDVDRIGKYVDSYKKYYLYNWANKPWNYIKNLKY